MLASGLKATIQLPIKQVGSTYLHFKTEKLDSTYLMLFQILDPSASTIVNVNIYLRTINDINDYKMVKGTIGEKNRLHFFS